MSAVYLSIVNGRTIQTETLPDFDTASNLDRPSVFRMNVGVSKTTYRSMFPAVEVEGERHLTALDQVMPHPVYGRQYWVCILFHAEPTTSISLGLRWTSSSGPPSLRVVAPPKQALRPT